MESVWLGLLVSLSGGFFALAGTYLNSRLALRREKEQWLRQQEAEQEKLLREERERARERLREIYENSIRSLTEYTSVPYGYDPADSGLAITPEDAKKRQEEDERYERERAKCLAEARRWLWALLINLPSPEKESPAEYAIEEFFENGSIESDLLTFVLTSARNDSRLKIESSNVVGLSAGDPTSKPKELHGI